MTGFSDLVLFNGSWWSMSDLELDYNYSIRANVTGNRTPAISWLNIDKESMEITSGKNGKLNVSFAPQGLKDGLYEAYIEVSSNSQTNPFVKIPVYMVNGELTSISIAENGKPAISLKGGTLTVKDGKAISSLNVSDIAGRNVKNVAANGNEAAVDLAGLGKGVYVVTVAYADGTSTSIKVPVLK